MPRQLTEALANPDPAAAKRAFEAMMTMVKINVACIEAALVTGPTSSPGLSPP